MPTSTDVTRREFVKIGIATRSGPRIKVRLHQVTQPT